MTSAAALELVRRSLAEVNAALCAALGERAVGLLGDEIGLRATPVPELGLVGDPVPTRAALTSSSRWPPARSRSSRRSPKAR